MANERTKQPRLAITVIAAAAVMLVAATTEMAMSGYVFAYNRNQATSGANACGNGQVPTNVGCQNTDSQIQGDENSAALTSQQTFPSIPTEPTPPPPPPPPPPTTGFTVTGSGKGNTETFTCDPPVNPGLTFTLDFTAQSDGTVSGTYTMSVDPIGLVATGDLTDGTTDGNTFTLSGEGDSICDPFVVPNLVTISGDCGDDVTITYEDESATGTLTGNVECTLT